MYHGKISKGDVFYVPAGWIILEAATVGPLCYGVRKSFFVDRHKVHLSYKAGKSLIDAEGGRSTDIMAKIMDKFQATSSEIESGVGEVVAGKTDAAKDAEKEAEAEEAG